LSLKHATLSLCDADRIWAGGLPLRFDGRGDLIEDRGLSLLLFFDSVHPSLLQDEDQETSRKTMTIGAKDTMKDLESARRNGCMLYHLGVHLFYSH
jgi:hypothetical protein